MASNVTHARHAPNANRAGVHARLAVRVAVLAPLAFERFADAAKGDAGTG